MKRETSPFGPNDTRRPDPRRELCEELATLLESPEVHRAAELLRGLQDSPSNSPPAPAGASTPETREGDGVLRPVSIWRPRQTTDGPWTFERPPIGLLGDHYADRQSFDRVKPEGRFRICWFGESAAAGYLLAPRYTPAKVLQAQLGSGYDILDLARTNEDLATLSATAEASLQLTPDAWVIYTGNNWTLLETSDLNPSAPSPEGLRTLARALRSGGLEAAIELARQRLVARVESSFRHLAGLAARAEIPVLLVIPEVNHADWDTRQPIPWLPGDLSSRWHRALEAGLEAFERDDLSATRAATEELLEIDKGRNPTSHRLQALVERAAGDLGAALDACRRSLDAETYVAMGCLGSPRASPFVQDLLRRLAARFGWRIVDLPTRFAELAGLPGDELFLDYCHLSEHGMREAMAATAEAVQTFPEAPAVSEPGEPKAAPEAKATSELGAAIHGAHRHLPLGSGRDQLLAWIRRSLVSSPEIVDTLLDLAEARISPGPEVLTRAQQRNLQSPFRLSLQHGWRWDHLDFELLAAIQTALLETRADGDELASRIDRWLIEHHAVETRPRDLSRPPYLWTPVARPFAEAMGRSEGGRRAFYRSLWPRSSFGLVSEGSGSVSLSVTVRLPQIPGSEEPRRGTVDILIDDCLTGSVEASESWTTSLLTLPSGTLRPGVQRVTLRWPQLPPAGDAAWAHALEEMELGREADFFPVFGEVFGLRASAGQSAGYSARLRPPEEVRAPGPGDRAGSG